MAPVAANGLGSVSASSAYPSRDPPLLRLPAETLGSIFAYASSSDLVSLSLVSRSFRDLAAAQLYRSLSHVFSDDTRSGQVSVDHLAGILETLTTSDYNYASYIKEISLDTAHAGEAGDMVAREFRYDYSCGKFLNTLFLATIKKVVSLETFMWNIRVGISPSVFAALGKLSTLHHLHIRMQAGPSLHSSPAPSTSSLSSPPPPGAVPLPVYHHQHHQHQHQHHAPPPPPASFGVDPKTPFGNTVNLVRRLDVHKLSHGPRNFSAFSNLKSLAVLDMDTLEYVSELAECISSSTTTLKVLKLSFSERLALKARKKAVADSSDTDTVQDEDELFDADPLMPPSPPLPVVPDMGSNDADIMRERLTQKKALARIFGLENDTPQQKKLEQVAEDAISRADKESQAAMKALSKNDADRLFVKELHRIMRDLAQKKITANLNNTKSLKAFEKLEKAASKYLERNENIDGNQKEKKKASVSQKASSSKFPPPMPPLPVGQSMPPPPPPGVGYDMPNSGDSFGPVFPSHIFPATSKKGLAPPKHAYVVPPSSTQPPGLFTPAPSWNTLVNPAISSTSGSSSEASSVSQEDAGVASEHPKSDPISSNRPEDDILDIVDMEHPDDDGEEGEDQEFIDADDYAPEDQDENISPPAERSLVSPSGFSNDFDVKPSGSRKGKKPARDAEPSTSNIQEFSESSRSGTDEESGDHAIQEYIRLHHGIPLESLSIYLIPVKPSILCRAINICSLKHVSLMNVGPQRAFWAMLGKLHQTTPLQLTSIQTDNVTPSFLSFLSELDYMEDLFLIERSSRSKVEPLTPKTTVTIDDIRKQVLSKHTRSLRRLMIRNDNDNSWALSKESVNILAGHGSRLTELVVALDSSNFHFLMHHISGLRSLLVFHILFAQNDYCPGILREIRLCAIDNIIQCPHLKIQYVAVSYGTNKPVVTSVSKLVREKPASTPEQINGYSFKDRKGKGKAVQFAADHDTFSPSPGSIDLAPLDDSASGDEFDSSERTKITVVDGVKFRDAIGIKVWDKDIWGLKL
ncbi:hypothetical protein AJ80_00024 [Polytolypa hystricis UAMH7299]|uniref:F-box domain-containing protein n=1 Tax=Polytolypa hystricis (strain UAMH7299) TaxID=1447883 RepID=A0A2B7YVL9_POLH7|nr:hypothetical protein AJ80_00024 [Polytolypa hystricis UAMH7299]